MPASVLVFDVLLFLIIFPQVVVNILILGITYLFASFVNVVLETMIISFVLLLIEVLSVVSKNNSKQECLTISGKDIPFTQIIFIEI